MLIYRGAITAAEDRNHHDERWSPVELEALEHAGTLPAHPHPTITAPAIVNHGRWIVRCPWCYSASMASRADRRFFCVECRNAGAEGRWVSVVWPDYPRLIEEPLIARPDPRTRNWEPGETLEDLLAENDHHGVR